MWLVTDYPLWFALIVVWLVAGIASVMALGGWANSGEDRHD